MDLDQDTWVRRYRAAEKKANEEATKRNLKLTGSVTIEHTETKDVLVWEAS